MGNPYTSVTVTNYNATPPPDDGTNVSDNEITWAKHKTKLGDPLKTAVEAIDTNLLAAFQKIMFGGVTSTATGYTVQASDQGKMIRVTALATITTPAAATVGTPFAFIVRNDHTADITVDGNGSETINGSATFTVPVGNAVMFGTDGTNWYTGSTTGVTRGNLQDQTHVYDVDTGAADAYVITLGPAVTAYAEGQRFSFKATNANTGASTLNVNSLGAKTIKKNGGAADLVAGDIIVSQIIDVEYDGTNFQLTGGLVSKVIDVQSFTGSGTWTKPSGYIATSKVLAQLWGAGGSGGLDATPGGSGGGGGGYAEAWFALSELGATETITIGAGGAAVTSESVGNAGGNSTLGSLLTAYGGGAGGGNGTDPGGGGGGGLRAVGGDGTGNAAAAGGDPFGGAAGSASVGGESLFGGGGGGVGGDFAGGASVHGGGGGGSSGGGGGNDANGGASYYGGGGGGGAGTAAASTGGVSTLGGDGGAGGNNGAGSDGTQPGGGGGGAISSTSGAGAAGQCIITVFPA